MDWYSYKTILKIANKKPHSVATKIYQIIIWMIGVVLALVPLLFSAQSVFTGMIFSKTILFWSLTTILIVLDCALIYLDREFIPKFSHIGWLFGGLLLILGFSTITSVQPYISLWGTIDRADGLISWLYYFAFFVVATGTIKTLKDWRLIINLSSLGVLLVGASTLYLFALNLGGVGFMRAEGTLGNPVFLGGYLAMSLPLLLAYVLGDKHPFLTQVHLRLTLVFGYIALLLTFSRGAWIAGLIATVLVLIFYFKKQQRPSPRSVSKIIFGLGIAGVIVWLGVLSFNQQFDALWQNNIASNQSLTYRLHIWKIGLQSFKEKPLLGWGLENFKVAFDQNFEQPTGVPNLPFSEIHADRAHNEYLDIAVTGGAMALIIYLLLMLTALGTGIKNLFGVKDDESRWLTIGFWGSLLAYLAFAVTAFHLIVNFLWVLLALVWMNNLSTKNSLSLALKLFSKITICVIAIIATTGAYLTVINPTLAISQASNGTTAFLGGKVDESLMYFKKSLSYKSFVSNTIRAQMAVLAINTSVIDNRKSSANNFHDYLGNVTKANFLTEPLNSHYHLLFGMYNGKFALINPSLIKSAEYHFQKCAQLSVNRGEVYLQWAKMYNNLGDKTRAKVKLEQAIRLAPTSKIVSAFAGFFYMLNGETEKGSLMLQKTLDMKPNTKLESMEGYGLLSSLGTTEELQKIKIFYSALSSNQIESN